VDLAISILEGYVSIHAPARGATAAGKIKLNGDCSFNPRPRAGGDFLLLLL